MKKLSLILILMGCFSIPPFAQGDTTILHFTESGDSTNRETSFIYAKFYMVGDLWHGQVFFSKNDILQSEGNYREKNFKYPVGLFKNYSKEGVLSNITTYNDSSKMQERTYFFRNGKRKARVINNNGKCNQTCWDSTGAEVSFCKIEEEATFKGGMDRWVKYLQKNLNAKVATKTGAPAGIYIVRVEFIINKEGQVTNAKAVEIPDKCSDCAVEAVRILNRSPKWEPAKMNGEPCSYRALQSISFVVEEETKSLKRRN